MVKNESNLLKMTNTEGSKRKLEITNLDHLDHAYVVVLARCSEVRWVTDREVIPGCARVRTKCAEKTGVGL